MGQGLAETLRDGAAQVARYVNREKLPIAVAAHRFQFETGSQEPYILVEAADRGGPRFQFDTGSQEPYILVMSGFICRRLMWSGSCGTSTSNWTALFRTIDIEIDHRESVS